MLKFKLDAEKFGTLNEVEQSFYAKSGDGYQLQVEGATDKAKLDEFRASNVDLLKQQEAFKGIDVSKYRDFEEQARKIKDKEFVDAKGSMFLGRGASFPIALEGALKLKELSY